MFSGPERTASPLTTIAWWEVRRIPFNIMIGMYGLLCLACFYWGIMGSGHLTPGDDAIEPIALLAAPFVINVLYCLGWLVEVPARLLRPGLSPGFGPVLLKSGLGLGLLLSSIPAAYWVGYRLLH